MVVVVDPVGTPQSPCTGLLGLKLISICDVGGFTVRAGCWLHGCATFGNNQPYKGKSVMYSVFKALAQNLNTLKGSALAALAQAAAGSDEFGSIVMTGAFVDGD